MKRTQLKILAVGLPVILFFICSVLSLAADPATLPSTRPSTTQSTQPTTAPAVSHHVAKPKIPDPPAAPFNLIEAVTEEENTSLTLRGIEADLNSDRTVAVIQEELPILKTEIDAREDETTKLLSSSPSLQVLGTQEQDWIGISQELDQWVHVVQHRQSMLGDFGKTLKQLDDRWESEWPLLDYYNKYGSRDGKPIRDNAEAAIQNSQGQISKTSNDFRIVSIANAVLGQNVNAQAARVKEILHEIDQARDDAFNRLFMRNDPPLWSVPLRSNGDTSLLTEGRDSFTRQMQAVIAYIRRRYANVALQGIVLAVLAIGLFRVRKVVGKWADEDAALKPVTRAFAAPIATALVLSFVISAWIYPRAPRMFWAIVGATALVPTVVILRRLIDKRLFPILNALVLFYFLDQLRSIVAVVPVVARFLLMLEMLGGTILLILFIRSTRAEKENEQVWNLIRFVGWVWSAVFSLAFLGDVFGYDSLANLMGDGALGSAYLAVILYACARVLSSLLVIAVRSRPFVLLGMVRRHQPVILFRLRRAILWIASAAWILGVLASLSVLTPVWEFVHKALYTPVTIGDLHLSIGPMLAFVITVWATVHLSRFVRFVLEEDVYDRLALPSGIPYAISRMVNYAMLILGFFIAISVSGVPLTQFTILASAFTLGIGFGLQNIFNNFVSGIILLFERPVRVGDVIQMNDMTGVVGHIGIRASIIRTSDSSEIIVPNGNLISNQVVNWTLSNRQRGLTIPVTIGSDIEPCRVIDLLQDTAAAQPLVTKAPPPQAFLTKLAADSFSYELHVWTNNAEQWVKLRSELAVALNAEFARQQIPLK